MKYRIAKPENTWLTKGAGNGPAVRCTEISEKGMITIDMITGKKQNIGWLPNPDHEGNIKLCLDSSAVTIRFSAAESAGTKEKIRDILTEAFEEKIQRELKKTNEEHR